MCAEYREFMSVWNVGKLIVSIYKYIKLHVKTCGRIEIKIISSDVDVDIKTCKLDVYRND